jgi:hypothetical protein
MPFNQDDQRERAMVAALNLEQRPERARHAEDAFKDVVAGYCAHRLLFECKSAPENSSFGTGRDTGMRKLEQWSTFHFVFGWFEARDNVPIKMWYGSPRIMRAWLKQEKDYLEADLKIMQLVPPKVDDDVVTALFGNGTQFAYDEINKVMKDRWKKKRSEGRPDLYNEYADVRRSRRKSENLYSRRAALQAAKDRTQYLLDRGGTVNNRKIPGAYVRTNCFELDRRHWARSLDDAINAEVALELPNNPVE